MAKGQLSFGNPIILTIIGVIAVAILYLLTVLLGQVGNLLKIYLNNFWLFTGLIVAGITSMIILVVVFKYKLAPKYALVAAIVPAALFLLIGLIIPDVAIVTDGVIVTVTTNVHTPGILLGVQLSPFSISSASITSEAPNSPLVPTPQTFSFTPLLSLFSGQSCDILGQCYANPPPAGFLPSGTSIAVQVSVVCDNGFTTYNQASLSDSTFAFSQFGGTSPVDVKLNNLPDHSKCTFTVQLSCPGGVDCDTTPYTFTSQVSSTNTGAA